MPDLFVFRPADAIETAECWALAIERRDGPSLLALTRQNLPAVRTADVEDNLCARGAYVLAEATGPRALTLLATGSEVHLALEARERLQAEGTPVAVVSMPCFELFERQETTYRERGAGRGAAPRDRGGEPVRLDALRRERGRRRRHDRVRRKRLLPGSLRALRHHCRCDRRPRPGEARPQPGRLSRPMRLQGPAGG